MSGSGRTTIASGATLTLNTTTHDLNRTLQNDGDATWTAGALQLNGATFINNGTFTVNSAGNLSCYGTGGATAFNNVGATVDPDWLEPLVTTLDADARIGAACPKILFADDAVEVELTSPTHRPGRARNLPLRWTGRRRLRTANGRSWQRQPG